MSDTPRDENAGDEWEYRERPVAIVTFKHPETGEEIGPIHLPYEGEPPSEEEAFAQARELYNRTEHIRGNISAEEIERIAEVIRREYEKYLRSELRTAFHQSLNVTTTPSDDDTPEDIEEEETAAEEVRALLREKGDSIVDAFLDESLFWRDFAHDALTHAWAWALDDLRAEQPDVHDLPEAEFHRLYIERYNEGGYLTGAILNVMPGWAEFLLEGIASQFRRGEDGTPGQLAEAIEQKARERIRKRTGQRPNLISPVLPFDNAGRGYLPSNGAYRAISQGLGRFADWQHKSGDTPEYQLPRKYGVSGHMSIAGGNALRIWEGIRAKAKQAKQYGDILPDVYIVIVATMHEHRSRLDLFGTGRPYIALDSLMHDLGIRKHDRKYHLDDIEKIAHAIAAIGDIRIRGMRTAYVDGQKPFDVPFEGPVWQIMETIPKTRTQRELDAFLAGERGEFTDGNGAIPPQSISGWTLGMSAGLLASDDESPQEARVMRALMDYPPVHGRFKRRLGFSLACEFRLRYRSQNWDQPYTVRDVLEDAALVVDTKDPRRTYKLFHEALERLQRDSIIGPVRYIRSPHARRPFDPGYNTGKKGWLEAWLAARIVIHPPADVEAHYREKLEERKSRRHGRKVLKTPA